MLKFVPSRGGGYVLPGIALLRYYGVCLSVATPVIAAEANSPALTYSPWTKLCLKDTCFIGRDGRTNPDCESVVSAAFIERNGDSKKTLRVTLPNRVSLEHGVRIIIDQGRPIERPGCRKASLKSLAKPTFTSTTGAPARLLRETCPQARCRRS
jgi:hypothetical protein